MSQLRRCAGLAAALALCALRAQAHALPVDVPAGRGELVRALVAESSGAIELAGAVRVDASDAYLVLVEGGIPGGWTAPPGEFRRISASTRASLRAAFVGQDRSWLRAFLSEIADGEARVAYRTQAIELAAEFAEARDLRLLLRLANPLHRASPERASKPVRLPREHREALRRAFGEVIRRDVGAYPLLVSLTRELEPSLVSASVDSLRGSGTVLGCEALAGMLEGGGVPEAYVLTALRDLAGELPHPLSEHVGAPVRDRIGDLDPTVAALAAETAGRLEDWEAVEALVDALGSQEPVVASAAADALQELTTRAYGTSPRLWRAWYEGELAWWRDERPACLQDLDSDEPARVLAAISAYAKHRLYREQLASELIPTLDRAEPLLVAQACAALGELGARPALGALVPLLHHEDLSVREAALRALRRATGKDLPGDEAAWYAALGIDDPS